MELPKRTVLGRKKETDVREGDLVKKLQEELSKLGYDLGDEAPGKKDHGKYGDKTQKAVEDFQQKKGLEVDGRVGPQTASAINKALTAGMPDTLLKSFKELNETQLNLVKKYIALAEEHIKKSDEANKLDDKRKELDKAKEALDKAAEILRKKKEEYVMAPSVPEKSLAEMTQEEFITAVAKEAEGTKHCVPVSVTVAQAILESGWGKSDVARNTNNLFGIKGNGPAGKYGEYRKYNNWKESVIDHGKILCGRRYKKAREFLNNPERYVEEKQKAGYAKDPKYAKRLKEIIEQYNLKILDK